MTNIKYIRTPYIGIDIQIETYENNKVFYFLMCTTSEEKCFDHFPTTQEVTDFRDEVVKPYNIQSFPGRA